MGTNSFHDDAQEQAKINNLIRELWLWKRFDFNYFNSVYKIHVERKRQKILEAIREIDNNHVDFPDEPLPAGKAQLKQMTLHTYYLYLENDDAYREKAFAEFIKKKMEGINNKACEERWGLHAHLEGLYEHSSYKEYQALTESREKLWVYQRHFWREFFRNSEEYLDVIPSERPPVLYTGSSTDIPRFIFEPPYTEYNKQEFHARYMNEWDCMHYNPLLYEDLHDHFIDLDPYRNELGDKPEKAYRDYQNAVTMFRKVQNMPNTTIKDDK